MKGPQEPSQDPQGPVLPRPPPPELDPRLDESVTGIHLLSAVVLTLVVGCGANTCLVGHVAKSQFEETSQMPTSGSNRQKK